MTAGDEERASADRLQLLEAKSARRLQWVKELVTAVLGVGIVVYTLFWTGRAFAMAGDPVRMGDAKDLLTYLSSFAGVVVGYYFARVPADARTAQAQQQMAQAQQEMGQAQQQMGQAVSEKERAVGEMGDMKKTMSDMDKELAGLEKKAERGEQLRPEDIQYVREMA